MGLLLLSRIGRNSWGVSTATTGFLGLLWQVQAGGVSLTLALAVFVFGLLPQTRGRATYREFLRRSWALPIVAFGVVSVVFDGLVLLGLGHQVHASSPSASDGHGFAVTLAVVVGLTSVASIGLLFVRTVKAIDPDTARSAQNTFRVNVVSTALHDELAEHVCLELMEQKLEDSFRLDTLARGRRIQSSRASDRIVRDISMWRLAALTKYASLRGHQQPIIHCWPGKRLSATSAGILMTVDSRSFPITRAWARSCIQVRSSKHDLFRPLLETLHADSLEHIRSDRPIEALEGMETLTSLLDLVWRAYAAHGRSYEQSLESPFWRPTVAQEISRLIYTELRAAAISRDEELRVKSARLPRIAARRALAAKSGASVITMLELYEGMYSAVVEDLMGRDRPLAVLDRVSRKRIETTVGALQSFVQSDVPDSLHRALGARYETDDPNTKHALLDAAELTVGLLPGINERVLSLLRLAVDAEDAPTVTRMLVHWSSPSVERFPVLFDQLDVGAPPPAVATGTNERPGITERESALARELADNQDQLEAMLLRLLVTAVHQEWEKLPAQAPFLNSTVSQAPPDVSSASRILPDGSEQRPGVIVAEVLARLPSMKFWRILTTAVELAQKRDWFPRRDSDYTPDGVVLIGDSQPVAELREVFVLALMVRPDLIDGSRPEQSVVLAHATALREATIAVVEKRGAWLRQYGVSHDEAVERARQINQLVTEMEQAALDAQASSVIEASIDTSSVARIEDGATASFNRFNILGKLLAAAGKHVVIEAASTADKDILAGARAWPERDLLIVVDSDTSALSRDLGRFLADGLLLKFIELIFTNTTAVDTTFVDAGASVNAALEGLRAELNTTDGTANPGGIVVMIPVWIQRELVPDLADTKSGDSSIGETDTPRQAMLARLGITDPDIAWSLAGTLNGVPVVQLSELKDKVIVADLARFAHLRLTSIDERNSRNPCLLLTEPEKGAVTLAWSNQLAVEKQSADVLVAEAASADFALENRVRRSMLHVRLEFLLYGKMHIDDAAAVRVLAVPRRD